MNGRIMKFSSIPRFKNAPTPRHAPSSVGPASPSGPPRATALRNPSAAHAKDYPDHPRQHRHSIAPRPTQQLCHTALSLAAALGILLRASAVELTDVFVGGDDGYPAYRIPALVTT